MPRNRLAAVGVTALFSTALYSTLLLTTATAAHAQTTGDVRPAAAAATGTIGPAQRRALIDALVDKWGPYVQATYGSDVDVWHDRLTMWFMKADATNLVDALKRETYDGAMATLIGRGARVSDTGDQSGARLGDTFGDLVYTPVQPCRIVDTRLTGAGPIAAAGSRNFIGINATSFATQGGSATNCNTFNVAATALAINVTAVTPTGNGYTTVFPYNTTQPLAAAITYATGAIVNNTVIAQIPNPLSSFDFTIYTFVSSHYVVDIVGYFAPPLATALQCVDTAQATATLIAGSAGISVAPACAAGYTPTSTNCAVSNLELLLAAANNGICAGNNKGLSDAILRASRTCCRVPGR